MLTRRLLLTTATAAAATPWPALAQSRPTVRVPADYKTVIEALNALPETGGTVEISPGTYREKWALSKTDVHLIGTGAKPEDVVLVWGDSAKMAGGTGKSASLTITGDGFRASNVTIQNDYHLNRSEPSQAVALYLTSDRAVLQNVRLLGAQDTLYAASKKPTEPSRQYYRDCYIEGHVDFIFGNALAFFDRFVIHIIAREQAFITAHSRTAETETTAYIFDHCTVTTAGDGSYYFGRAWRPYGQVVFLDTRIDGKIHPEGWREWTPGKTETYTTAHFAEYGSTGPGANDAMRVFWADRLTPEDAAKWRLEAVFPDRAWIGITA
ncbi:pectinesterase family protein [Asticcacaulis biprosthecium C19]|uniref:Pectinesterase family protein n=1 Tax=Asticcacaulis biprosthecium C19 TaxID=715226 RepID=F4QN71_9CAUL|nr:pectinesterase family protein [Asticcacaulis biprosthecium]EGF91662.1 pectinesterase family protein [Asticcacaulis biprosthecium C19]